MCDQHYSITKEALHGAFFIFMQQVWGLYTKENPDLGSNSKIVYLAFFA